MNIFKKKEDNPIKEMGKIFRKEKDLERIYGYNGECDKEIKRLKELLTESTHTSNNLIKEIEELEEDFKNNINNLNKEMEDIRSKIKEKERILNKLDRLNISREDLIKENVNLMEYNLRISEKYKKLLHNTKEKDISDLKTKRSNLDLEMEDINNKLQQLEREKYFYRNKGEI